MLIKNKYLFKAIFFAIILFIQDAHAQGKLKAKLLQGFSYDAKDKRDPFNALVTIDGRILEPPVHKEKSGEIQLEGIIYDAHGESCAVINTEVFKAGDTIGEYTIVRIEPQKVIFLKSGNEIEIELKKEDAQ